MLARLQDIFDDRSARLGPKVVAIYALLVMGNLGAWIWAFIMFRHYPVLLGTAFLAYGFGLRHAVDADHITAIDNVTRKLMQDGKRPVAVGFFFSLGHSTIVVLASVGIALTASRFRDHLGSLGHIGGVIGTSVSAIFLLTIAVINMFILRSVYRIFQKVQKRETFLQEDLDQVLAGRGVLNRFLAPLFNLIHSSWQMYPLGFLFGLGFDTATEVGLLGLSATEACKGLPIWSILVFPTLFTVGMSLVDTTDSLLMLGAYGWAFVKPVRKVFYNLTLTFVSVVVALLVGGVEALGLIGDRFDLKGFFWQWVGSLNDNFGRLGYAIVLIFALCWLASLAIYKLRGWGKGEEERGVGC